MKVSVQNIAQPKVLVCERTGAKAGDKILFSSHNKENGAVKEVFGGNVVLNKIYEVILYEGWLRFIGETGPSSAGFKDRVGSFDIIEVAPMPHIEKVFEPVVITIETPEELIFFAELFGCVGTYNNGYGPKISENLDKILKDKGIERKLCVYSVRNVQ